MSPALHLFTGDEGEVDVALVHLANFRKEARVGGHDRSGISVGLHHAGVGIDGEERFQLPQVDGVFEQPAALGIRRSDQLDHLLVPDIGLRVRRAVVPLVVEGQRRRGLESVVGETLGEDVSALLWPVRLHLVHRHQVRGGVVQEVELAHGGGEIGVRLPLVARRARLRLGGEPVLELLQAGVLPHEVVQCRAAGADEAGDDDGPADLILENLGTVLQLLHGAQARRQDLGELPAVDLPAQWAQVGVLVEGGEQHLETFSVGRVSEVVEAGLLARVVVESVARGGEALEFGHDGPLTGSRVTDARLPS